MPRTKKGGALAMLKTMGRNELLLDRNRALEHMGQEIRDANKQLKLDQEKEDILQKELLKVRKDKQQQEQKRKRGQMKLLQVLAANKMLGMMHELVLLSDIKGILDDESQEHTLIFPTDDNLEDSNLDIDKLKANKDALNEFLKDYILRGSIHTDDLKPEKPVPVTNLNGKQLAVVKQKGKVLVKHQGKPVAVIVHKDLTHKDDESLPASGNIHSITDITPTLEDTADKALDDARETATNLANTARKTVSTATGTARKAMNTVLDTVGGLFGRGDETEKTDSKPTTVGGGRKRKRKRKRKTKRKTKSKRRKAKKSKRKSRR